MRIEFDRRWAAGENDGRSCGGVCRTVFCALAAGVWLTILPGCCYYAVKPLPDGLSYRSEAFPAEDVCFLSDQTCVDASGVRVVDQHIFDKVFAMIGHANRLVVIDMFLFNEFLGKGASPHRRLCEGLTDALIARKRVVPGLRAVVITDPVNTVYGGLEARHLTRLREAGIEVVLTRLSRLRDGNVTWSSVWRLCFWPCGNNPKGGWLANPFGGEAVTLRSWFALLNFKANHRKVVVADTEDGLRALVTSANPHDGSSAHSNVGVVFGGSAARAVLESEQAVLAFSGSRTVLTNGLPAVAPRPSAAASVRVGVVTEEKIADAAEAMLGAAGAGDTVDLIMFYLSDRRIVRALKAAAKRGAVLRVVLDPNKDAFGREKNGMPNRQVARELVAAGVPVRWALTHGEQMHAKMLLVRKRGGAADLLLGSANFTRRNVRDYNLETDVQISGTAHARALADAAAYVERLWSNPDGRTYTAGYEAFRDDSGWRTFRYRFQEATGLCTW